MNIGKFKETDIREPILVASNLFTGKDLICAEIGVAEGNHAEVMLELLRPKQLYLIDNWKGLGCKGSLSSVVSRFKNYSNVKIINKDSSIASWELRSTLFDVVYLDADHTYDAVKEDLECWFPLIKSGGMLAGHDWNKPSYSDGTVCGVQQAVIKFLDEQAHLGDVKEFHISKNERNYWIIKR